LVTIQSKDEQDFLSNLLFKTHKVVDAVWIGAKYSSNKFKWIDDSDISFTNWAEGSPKNKTDFGCVQMIPEGSSIGKWVDEPCNKNNKVVCQKKQTWSLSRLQKTLLNARKELQNSLEDVKKNPVPIGFIYVQLPNEKSPTEIWPWMTWNDVSSAYAGVFFRVTGGDAASFGQVQEDNAPHLTGFTCYDDGTSVALNNPRSTQHSLSETCRKPNTYLNGISFSVSGGEVRPRNMAIRIWKRTG
jgi:hypothetical protein